MLAITVAEADDIPDLVEAHGRAFADDRERYGMGPAGFGDPAWHQMIRERLHYFAMREGGEIVGGIIVADEGEGRFFINTLFVDPAAQGLGYGAQALAFLDATFPDAWLWWLVTPQGSLPAQRLYERSGYVRVGSVTETNPATGASIALYRYERERERVWRHRRLKPLPRALRRHETGLRRLGHPSSHSVAPRTCHGPHPPF